MRALEILDPGPRATVQDAGRPGWRSAGVPVCGAADKTAWRLACGLSGAGGGAGEGAAAIEFALRGPVLRAVGGAVRVALAGAAGRIEGADGALRALPAFASATLAEGETLRVGAVEAGAFGYLAADADFDLPLVMGSRATDLRAGFGGLEGRSLRKGDRLAVPGPAPRGPERALTPPPPDAGPLRVIPGPQDDHFTPEALARFTATDWRVSAEVDRMGARLQGEGLTHNARGADITSDGLTVGAIQVPGDGLPIILGPDSHTIGGYPKIATIITADLSRAGQLTPGALVRFRAVTLDQARAAAVAARAALDKALAAMRPFHGAGGMDLAALASGNLVSGMIDAQAPRFPGSLEETP